MDWTQLNVNELEEVELDFNKSSKRMKMNKTEDVMEIDLEFNVNKITQKITTLKKEVEQLMQDLNILHLNISN
tara:strand:+ start:982 stop:1200 length:219 start_codon:yes stop_codon:yes gene_type:complete